jgi:hypothetical protein
MLIVSSAVDHHLEDASAPVAASTGSFCARTGKVVVRPSKPLGTQVPDQASGPVSTA